MAEALGEEGTVFRIFNDTFDEFLPYLLDSGIRFKLRLPTNASTEMRLRFLSLVQQRIVPNCKQLYETERLLNDINELDQVDPMLCDVADAASAVRADFDAYGMDLLVDYNSVSHQPVSAVAKLYFYIGTFVMIAEEIENGRSA